MSHNRDRIAVIYGTRPEMIKLAPLVKLLGRRAHLIHTGQHFDGTLSGSIARELSLPTPDVNLGVGGENRALQIGSALTKSSHLVDGSDAVIVQGDTNSALAGALAGNSFDIPVFHVEAGLRSYDRRMPEEHNRVLIDHLADICWAPTTTNRDNLEREGISGNRVTVTGNSIVEALASGNQRPTRNGGLFERLEIDRRGFALVTLHRPENVDDPGRLESILKNLAALPVPVVLPIHPRTLGVVEAHGLEPLLGPLRVIPPIGYGDFLALMGDAAVVISDSGGVQEEVSILKVPLVVLRRSTERPEVIGTFARITENPEEMRAMAAEMVASGESLRTELSSIECPFGDGNASTRMYESLEEVLEWS